ncbi:MAG: dihydrofolate reductase [Claussenomyces sp. TS43310]|nr:MAG: dihydrofolate reductase [Claussenomyces sp. TS43310]
MSSPASQQPQAVSMLPLELNLIVAATRNMGIGRLGTLPWTGLRKEMAYFARVTKRVEAGSETSSLRNVVIMGRKTWDSIPQRFRPLRGRLNVVLSRSDAPSHPAAGATGGDGPLSVTSIAEALDRIRAEENVGKLFVMGGAEIYNAVMEMEQAKRILMTRIITDFDCETFFPAMDQHVWHKKSKDELDEWTGEKVPEGIQEENGVQYVFEMYERV